MTVRLVEITEDTVRDVCDLQVAKSQNLFVAPNSISLAQALFCPEAWYRAIYEGDTLVGFIMLYDETLREKVPEKPEVDIWRFMVAEKHQGKGIGKKVLNLIINSLRERDCFSEVKLSYVPGNAPGEGLYADVGFRATGEIDDGEIVMSFVL